jgi:hypothetical protein
VSDGLSDGLSLTGGSLLPGALQVPVGKAAGGLGAGARPVVGNVEGGEAREVPHALQSLDPVVAQVPALHSAGASAAAAAAAALHAAAAPGRGHRQLLQVRHMLQALDLCQAVRRHREQRQRGEPVEPLHPRA